MLFDQHVRLPVDLIWGTRQSEGVRDVTEWVGRHHDRLLCAYHKVSEGLGAAASKKKCLYNMTVQEARLLPGERMLVYDNRRSGRGKISDQWEAQPYIVQSQSQPNQPVYTVRPEGRSGPEQVIHRNLLQPCPHYPVLSGGTTDQPPLPPPPPPRPLMGWAWIPAGPRQPDEDPEPEPRRSQRCTQGRPPQRYGNWGS